MRKLAYLAPIKNIRAHPNADLLEIANINHWQVIVKKGEFTEGETVIYLEVDSLIPRKDFSEFLFKNPRQIIQMDNIEYYPLRSVELRGELSQGLVLPVSILGEHLEIAEKFQMLDTILGIKKHEPVWDNKDIIGKRPHWIRSTSVERIQNIDVLPFPEGCYFSEKIDGETFICYFDEAEKKFGVCSNEVELAIYSKNNLVQYFLSNPNIFGALAAFNGKSTAFFGEYFEGEVYFFNSRNLYNEFLGLSIFRKFNLKVAPQLGFYDDQDIDHWIEIANGYSLVKPGARREGIILRDLKYIHAVKVISNEYLLRGR